MLFDIDVVYDVDIRFVQWIYLSIVLELIGGIYGYVIGSMDMFDVWCWNYSNHGFKEDMWLFCSESDIQWQKTYGLYTMIMDLRVKENMQRGAFVERSNQRGAFVERSND